MYTIQIQLPTKRINLKIPVIPENGERLYLPIDNDLFSTVELNGKIYEFNDDQTFDLISFTGKVY